MKREKKILTSDCIGSLNHPAEKGLALVLLSIPHLLVYYEPNVFIGSFKGRTSKFCPDFLVVNTRNPSSVGRYVEITNTNGSGQNHDPKARQRAIMRQNGEGCVFLLKKHLMSVARAHPNIDFGYTEKQLSQL